MPHKVATFIATLFVCGSMTAFAVYGYVSKFAWTSGEITKNRASLTEIYKASALNSERSDAALSVVMNGRRRNQLYVQNIGSIEIWRISAPAEFLQSNWVLTLCFDKNHLVGKYFGIADDVLTRPASAPEADFVNAAFVPLCH